MKDSPTAWRWLFPEVEHMQLAKRGAQKGMAWYDADLNDEQRVSLPEDNKGSFLCQLTIRLPSDRLSRTTTLCRTSSVALLG